MLIDIKRIKLPAIILAFLLALSLIGCGKQNQQYDRATYLETSGNEGNLTNPSDFSKVLESGNESITEQETIVDSIKDVDVGDESAEDSPAENSSSDKIYTEDSVVEDIPAEDGVYTSKDDVALYIHIYGKLPGNFITKREAQQLGWSGGSLEDYAPGKCIGGGKFGNYEGLLPEKKGRVYHECDIDTLGKKSRGAKRIVYSNDGLIYYTGDHYESFELLYGEP